MKNTLLTSVLLFLFICWSNVASAQTVPCVQSNECFDFAYSYVVNTNGTVTVKFDVTINCNRDLSNVAFGLPAGTTASAYTGSNNVENATNSPFYSIKFEGLNGKNGAVRSFTYTISASAFASMTTIRAYAKAAGTVGQVTFNTSGCGPTPPTCAITAAITGPDTVCAYNDEPYTFTTPIQTGATYTWAVPADWTLDNGQGTNTITVFAGFDPGDVTVTVTNACGTASDIQPVAVNEDCGLIAPLPVELISFEGKASAEGIALTWSTATEKNNDRFEVQRSADGRSFETIGTVKGNGSTTTQQAYNFTDKRPVAGLNYFRLRQVDFDGKAEFSDVVSVSANAKGERALTLYPNPATGGEFNVRITPSNELVTLQITDLSGKLLHTKEVKNTSEVNINGSSLGMKPGIYLVSLKAGKNVSVEKLIVR